MLNLPWIGLGQRLCQYRGHPKSPNCHEGIRKGKKKSGEGEKARNYPYERGREGEVTF